MIDSPWVSEQKASETLGVSELTLQRWREVGYLRPGTHWRSLPNSSGADTDWNPEFIYHLRWSREAIEYWMLQDAPMTELAA